MQWPGIALVKTVDSIGSLHTFGVVPAYLCLVIWGKLLVGAMEKLAIVSCKAAPRSCVVATDSPRLGCHRTIHTGIDDVDVDDVVDEVEASELPASPRCSSFFPTAPSHVALVDVHNQRPAQRRIGSKGSGLL